MTAPYRDDPRWQEAHARYLDGSGNDVENLMRSISAAFDLYRIEHEHTEGQAQ